MVSAIFCSFFVNFSVLLGRLGRHRSFLTVSLPGSPRALPPSISFPLGSSVRSDGHPRGHGGSDVQHISPEGSSGLSCSGSGCCGKHVSNYLLYVCNMSMCCRVFGSIACFAGICCTNACILTFFVIFLCPLIFHFVSIDEKPAMGSQPNLASRLEVVVVVSIYKCFPKILGPSPKFGVRKTSNFLPLFRDFHTRHRISLEQNVALTNKNASVNLQCVPYRLTYFSRPLTQKRCDPFAHCDTLFGGHYVATIIVATCLVSL